MDWNLEEKAQMFDEIASHYYNNNFGTFSKSEMDLLMFSFYLDKELKENTDENGILDYNLVSDYSISKKLCITQQKVKSLKVKKQLVYPIEYDWKKAFSSLLKKARYDKNTQKIIISIPDPNLLIEIQNYVEERGGYISKQINSKLLQMRVEYYIELVVLVSDEKSKKKIINAIKTQVANNNQDESLFDEENIGKSLLDLGVNITSIISNISSLISPDNIIFESLRSVLG